MWKFLMMIVLPAVIPALFGFLGWIATNFFIGPLLKFYQRRTAIHESLFYFDNVWKRDDPLFREAVEELRRHAAMLDAFRVTSFEYIIWWLSLRGYNLQKASGGLVGLSNSLDSRDGAKAIQRNGVEVGLKLPCRYSASQIEAFSNRF